MKKLLVIPVFVALCAVFGNVGQSSYSQQMKRISIERPTPESTRAKVTQRRFEADTAHIKRRIGDVMDSLRCEFSETVENTEKREVTVGLQESTRMGLLEAQILLQKAKIKIATTENEIPDTIVVELKKNLEPSPAEIKKPKAVVAPAPHHKKSFFEFFKFWK